MLGTQKHGVWWADWLIDFHLIFPKTFILSMSLVIWWSRLESRILQIEQNSRGKWFMHFRLVAELQLKGWLSEVEKEKLMACNNLLFSSQIGSNCCTNHLSLWRLIIAINPAKWKEFSCSNGMLWWCLVAVKWWCTASGGIQTSLQFQEKGVRLEWRAACNAHELTRCLSWPLFLHHKSRPSHWAGRHYYSLSNLSISKYVVRDSVLTVIVLEM